MHVNRVHVTPVEVERGHWIPWSWSYGWFKLSDMGAGNGTQVSLEEQLVLCAPPPSAAAFLKSIFCSGD